MTDQRAHKPTVVVTGAGSGIGRAVAYKLAMSNLAVIGVDIEEDALDQMCDSSVLASACCGDVAELRTLQVAATTAESIGPLVGWVNNAALIPDATPLRDLDVDQIERVLRVNLLAVIEGVRIAASRLMAGGRSGSIVNLSSVHARHAFPGWSSYAIAKAGVEALTRAAALEYGPSGIRVNAVAPALVAVERWSDDLAHLAPEEAAARVAATTALYPLRSLADPGDIAAAVAFLLGSEARFITGTTLTVDGGFSAAAPVAPEVQSQ